MAEGESLFASLSEEGRELVPVNLRLLPAPDAPAPDDPVEGRTAESAHYRSRQFHCYAFHKPISRPYPTRRP